MISMTTWRPVMEIGNGAKGEEDFWQAKLDERLLGIANVIVRRGNWADNG